MDIQINYINKNILQKKAKMMATISPMQRMQTT